MVMSSASVSLASGSPASIVSVVAPSVRPTTWIVSSPVPVTMVRSSSGAWLGERSPVDGLASAVLALKVSTCNVPLMSTSGPLSSPLLARLTTKVSASGVPRIVRASSSPAEPSFRKTVMSSVLLKSIVDTLVPSEALSERTCPAAVPLGAIVMSSLTPETAPSGASSTNCMLGWLTASRSPLP